MITETENILASSISMAEQKERLDASCKKILPNKIILAWIMKHCMEEFREYQISEIAEKYIEGSPQIASVAVHPCSGEMINLFINIEAQDDYYPGYPLIKRGIYYGSRMISSQYGTEFTDQNYGKIKKVYSVWICTSPPKFRQNTISEYAICERNMVGDAKEKRKNYDLMTIIMLCQGNTEETENTLLRMLDVLFPEEEKAESKKHILEKEFDIKMSRILEMEMMQMCNYSDGVLARGIRKGIEQGIEQGIQKGEFQTLVSLVRQGLLQTADAAKQIHVTEEEFVERMKEVEQ